MEQRGRIKAASLSRGAGARSGVETSVLNFGESSLRTVDGGALQLEFADQETERATWLLLGDGLGWLKFVGQLATNHSGTVSASSARDVGNARHELVIRQPALLVLEWRSSTTRVVQQICSLTRSEFPAIAIVAAVLSPCTESRVNALNAGADDCVGYDVDERELAARAGAIRRRRNGQISQDRTTPAKIAALARQHRLSPREQEVLVLLARGVHLKSIGASLGCGYSTVRTHIRRICSKLDCSCQREILARFVIGASNADADVYPIC